MKKVLVIGAGVSGLSVARLLCEKYDVTVYERDSQPGGLIRCKKLPLGLFHTCGGHVFNSKDQAVLNWFWQLFDRDRDFVKARRRSVICMTDGRFIGYPLEDHVYQLPEETQSAFYRDLKKIESQKRAPQNFKEFLLLRFGETLCREYFFPYNLKIWRRELSEIPLSWLEGKLPMPTVEEMRRANSSHVEEDKFVHSSFWYPREGGSQFIADVLAKGLRIEFNHNVRQILLRDGAWNVDGKRFDSVVFCGNLKELPTFLRGVDIDDQMMSLRTLESHGTTTVFCSIDENPYSWVYQPSPKHQSHRIICTGNFSSANNLMGTMTATVEFTDRVNVMDVERELTLMPFHPTMIDMAYNNFTYPVQNKTTRALIKAIRSRLARRSLYVVGRFAEWEYYNMDAAIASAMRTCSEIEGS